MTANDHSALICLSAKRIIDSGGRCSTELVTRAAGIPMTDTSMVYRALRNDPELEPDWHAHGMYTTFKRRRNPITAPPPSSP